MVHGETSTGVVNPIQEMIAAAREHGALTIVDAVTSLGGVPLTTGEWDVDVCYSCTQKGLGAPSGLAPITFSKRALERARRRAAFYLDLGLLEDYWVRRKYHHTISAPLIYALHEALVAVDEEGLAGAGIVTGGTTSRSPPASTRSAFSLLPPHAERLWTLNAVRVPTAWTNRRCGGGCSRSSASRSAPASGRWRGKSGGSASWGRDRRDRTSCCSSARSSVCCARADTAPDPRAPRSPRRSASSPQSEAACARSACADQPRPSRGCRHRVRVRRLHLPDAADVRPLRTANPPTTAFIELRAREAHAPRASSRGASSGGSPYGAFAEPQTRRAGAEDSRFWTHEGVDFDD
jgi:hypothetical protein